MDNVEKINIETKEAWSDNWKDISIETIMEIFDYPRVKKLLSVIEPYLPKDGCILEAGCGLGPWVIKLGTLGYDMVGVDYQEECIAKIKRYDKNQKVYAADVRSIPFANGYFNAYLSWGVIEHFAEGPDAALREAHRVLKKDGRLILTVPYNNIFRRIKEPIVQMKRNPLIRKLFGKAKKTYYYQRYFSVKELEAVISKSNFIVEDIIPTEHIFSLVDFSSLFRNRKSLDGENNLAVFLGNIFEKILPWPSAGATLILAKKA